LTFFALDFETTGLDCTVGRVVEIGAIRFRLENEACVEEASLSCLVNPGMPIPHKAKAIHGISDRDVAGAPAFGRVAHSLLAIAADAVIVAHNVRFDLSFLDAELSRAGIRRPEARTEDTVALAKRAFPGRASYSLGAIATALGIDTGYAHRALDDARTCMLLYFACARQLR
jgi:DNA polymerase III epsilon subunit family exonuclease